ncbi:LysR family transcriptional regulator [Methylocapsa acidiphila]|uniref:LysR family transcriptional regulator n=1 Tax=Methylocapsa acidiphila TaxID=133552 RepID=UPI000405FE63|nr:LysR family transcriptional regulator [Methylocapsa acidiphila]
MELYQIRHFVAIIETGSFTKGAQRAAVSQPAISASIARLEAELDVKLLDRRRAPVVPTAAGAHLLETGKAILNACNKVKADLKAIRTPRLLRIGILQSLSSRHVSGLLSGFRRANPHVAIEVFDGSSEQLSAFLEEQQLDSILTILNGAPSTFASLVLFKEPYVLAVPEEHKLAHRKSVSLADLHDEPFILRTRCDFYHDSTKALAARGIKVRVIYQTDQDDRALALVAAGLGLAFVPAHFGAPLVRQVPVDDLGLVREVGLLWRHEREDDDLAEFAKFAGRHLWTD